MKKHLLISALLSIGATAQASGNHSDPAKAIDNYLSHCAEIEVCNGSYLVAEQGKVLVHKAFGVESEKSQKPLTVTHMFDIGSVSKQFTASAIMRLKDQGKLSFDDELSKYIPEIDYPGVTLTHLLNHTSGLPDVWRYFNGVFRRGELHFPVTNQRLVSVLATENLPAVAKPGQEWKYSNTGYTVLASVVERVSGQSFHDYLKYEFFIPLNMRDTAVYRVKNDENFDEKRSWGFGVTLNGKKRSYDQIPQFSLVGGGAIYSTTSDMYKWATALDEGSLFKDETWKLATTPTTYGDNEVKEYGFGWVLQPTPSGKVSISHSGHWRGFKSQFLRFPEQKQTVIILTNNGQDDSVDDAAKAISDMLDGKKVQSAKRDLSRALYKPSTEGDINTINQMLTATSDKSNSSYYVEERMVNRLGYQLLEMKKFKEALMVMEFNNHYFPESANTFDSLAEAYAMSGEHQRGQGVIDQMEKKFPEFTDYAKRRAEIKALNPTTD